jgi:hypothetical protein
LRDRERSDPVLIQGRTADAHFKRLREALVADQGATCVETVRVAACRLTIIAQEWPAERSGE